MNIADVLSIQRELYKCLLCGKLTREDEPFCCNDCERIDKSTEVA